MHYIYIIQNQINLKIYVGQTVNIRDRWSKHKSAAKIKNDCFYIHHAINKYGERNFTFQIIEEFENQDDVNEAEKFWISFFNSQNREYGYNLRDGGNVSKHSQESKMKMSTSKLGVKLPESHKANISKSQIGKKLTTQHKYNISISLQNDKAPWFGKKLSAETKNKMSLANIGKILSEETKNKMSISSSGEKNPQFGKAPPNKTQLLDGQEYELVELYKNGSSIFNLKKLFKISQNRVKDILLKNNIEVRKIGTKCKK